MATFRLSPKVPDPNSRQFVTRVIRNNSLSFSARGVLGFVAMNPQDNTSSLIDHLLNHGLDSREVVESAIDELVEAGYLIKEVE